MGYSWAWGKLIHEKKTEAKILVTLSFNQAEFLFFGSITDISKKSVKGGHVTFQRLPFFKMIFERCVDILLFNAFHLLIIERCVDSIP